MPAQKCVSKGYVALSFPSYGGGRVFQIEEYLWLSKGTW